MLAGIPKEWLADKENAAIADGFFAAPVEVLMRFGRWDELLKEPEPEERLVITRALRHAARGVAYTARKEIEKARAEQKAFRTAIEKVPKEARFGNNAAADLLAIAEELLEGEVLVD